VCAGVSLQVKSIIESLSTEGAQVTLGVAVALHVAVEESLKTEDLGTEPALKLGGIVLRSCWRKFFQPIFNVTKHFDFVTDNRTECN